MIFRDADAGEQLSSPLEKFRLCDRHAEISSFPRRASRKRRNPPCAETTGPSEAHATPQEWELRRNFPGDVGRNRFRAWSGFAVRRPG